MPRYIVERSFADGLQIPINSEGAKMCLAIALNNDEDSVTWLHSYVSEDGTKTFCAYEAPSPEAIRRSARRNKLPIDRITEVRVLDPYFFH
jgi:hypothetical protein